MLTQKNVSALACSLVYSDGRLFPGKVCHYTKCNCTGYHPGIESTQSQAEGRGRQSLATASASFADMCGIIPRVCKTPDGNTGSNSPSNTGSNSPSTNITTWDIYESGFEPYVDYLQGTGYCLYSDLESLVKWYSDNACDEFYHKSYTYKYVGDTRYLHTWQSILALYIQYVPMGEKLDTSINAEMNTEMNADLDLPNNADMRLPAETPIKFHFTMPGKPLGALGFRNTLELMRLLDAAYNFKCSRLDSKVRCHDKIIDFDTLESIIESKDFTPSMQHSFYKSSTPNSDIEGRTITLGTPSSDKRISFYYALPVHNIDALDIEVRLRNVRAQDAFRRIIGTEEENLNFGQSAEIIHKIVAGSVDFVYKEEGVKNLDRCLRYEFWGKFIDAAGGAIRVRKPKVQFDGVKQIQWIETKCYKALAIAKELLGGARFHKWIQDMCHKGKAAFTAEHEAYIRLYKSTRIFDNRFAVNNL